MGGSYNVFNSLLIVKARPALIRVRGGPSSDILYISGTQPRLQVAAGWSQWITVHRLDLLSCKSRRKPGLVHAWRSWWQWIQLGDKIAPDMERVATRGG